MTEIDDCDMIGTWLRHVVLRWWTLQLDTEIRCRRNASFVHRHHRHDCMRWLSAVTSAAIFRPYARPVVSPSIPHVGHGTCLEVLHIILWFSDLSSQSRSYTLTLCPKYLTTWSLNLSIIEYPSLGISGHIWTLHRSEFRDIPALVDSEVLVLGGSLGDIPVTPDCSADATCHEFMMHVIMCLWLGQSATSATLATLANCPVTCSQPFFCN